DAGITGGNGNDFLIGNQGADGISGGNGDDLIRGGQGGDAISGGNGNDLIFGDLGTDAMAGGNGNDTFAFDAAGATSASNPSPVGPAGDTIVDFDLLGDDRLDLGAAGNALNFVNTGQSATTEAGAPARAASHMNWGVIYLTGHLRPRGGPPAVWDTHPA